jgi:hypothetical protein
LEVESDVAGFLGVLITKKPDDTIHLTQTGLIQRILLSLHMADFNTKETSAEHGWSPIDKDGDLPQRTYSYPSMIGMLGYLGHTRLILDFQQVIVRALLTIQDAHMKRHWKELSVSEAHSRQGLNLMPHYL